MTEQQQPEIGKNLIESLNELAGAIEASNPSDASLIEQVGWNAPGADRHDLAYVARCIRERLEQASSHGIPEEYRQTLDTFATRVDFLRTSTLPYLWNGHGAQAATNILVTLLMMDQSLADYLPKWVISRDLYSLPPKLVKRIQAAEIRVREIEETGGNIQEKIEKILAAHDAADAFPADIELLESAQIKITNATREVEAALARAKIAAEDAEKLSQSLKEAQAEAKLIIQKCNDTFRIATSTGLAWAFDERAKELKDSVRGWVIVLLGALLVGGISGAFRVSALSDLIAKGTALDWGAIAMQLVLSIASVGAPIWLAWLATKQVGQRFRLAEDYAFKASVAKAYEGYRKEAIDLENTDFAGRLFGVALERLEEAPLRLVKNDPMHASPFQELITSPVFQRALEASGSLRDLVASALAAASAKRKTSQSSTAPKQSAAADAD